MYFGYTLPLPQLINDSSHSSPCIYGAPAAPMSEKRPKPTELFPGLLASKDPKHMIEDDHGEVELDLEEEQSTIPDLREEDNDNDTTSAPEPGSSGTGGLSQQIAETVQSASKGIRESTYADYIHLINQCSKFLIKHGLISKPEDFFNSQPSADTPTLIIAWIMHECDTLNLITGKIDNKPSGPRASYPHAEKMCSSMTHAFGRLYSRCGSQQWEEMRRPDRSVYYRGNPSICDDIAKYMLSLRRRKAQIGEVSTSARAITTDVFYKLYHHNNKPENWTIQPYQPGNRKEKKKNHWGGPMARRLLMAIYTVSFICLLRIDEAIKIRRQDVVFHEGSAKMTITLPTRKTHQFGNIKPFVLYALAPEDAHICPVRAMAQWITASKITEGFLFRRIASGDRPSQNNAPVTSQQVLDMFRNNLVDVNIDPSPYGTHSFRRGGCQYLVGEKRWNLREICDWGGWSTEFSSLTIVKYVISWNDASNGNRDDLFNPDRPPATKCGSCGRSCHCGS